MKVQESKSEKIFKVFNYTIVSALCLTIILPFLNILALSFNQGADSERGGIYFWPRAWTLENFSEVFRASDIMNAMGISIFRTVVGTFVSVLLTALAAYALKKKSLPGRRMLTFFIFFTMLFSGGTIPYYLVLKSIGLTNTIWVYIIPGLYSVYNIMIMRTFFMSIPVSLEEAARIDGATEFGIFFKLILPMSKPVITTIALFNAVNHWNDWFTGAFYVRNAKLRPLSTLLQEMLTKQEALSEALLRGTASYDSLSRITLTGESLKMATIIVAVAPIIVIYPFVQKHFVKGVSIGSIKE
ncbi:carbohydrate ABC transporter permease [Enterococcus sp.]|uniref:carbohydrate ABC transporter permease n=1 Tax=Enterococcus sp. TaxID=35783 RepID=UPI002FCB80D4